MAEPVTSADVVRDWDKRSEGVDEVGAMSVHIVRVLIEIREELTALREAYHHQHDASQRPMLRPIDTGVK
jgi:hypothetical protein